MPMPNASTDSKPLRLFVAIKIPSAITHNLSSLGREIPDHKILAGGQAHLTLRFLGDTPPESVERIQKAFSAIQSPAFELEVKGLGVFGRRPRTVLWAGLTPNPDLSNLKQAVDAALFRELSLPVEKRFTPHLTLARLKCDASVAALIKERANHDFGRFRATEYHLMKSELHPRGAIHSSLAGFQLG